jgi:hypothetical protein
MKTHTKNAVNEKIFKSMIAEIMSSVSDHWSVEFL